MNKLSSQFLSLGPLLLISCMLAPGVAEAQSFKYDPRFPSALQEEVDSKAASSAASGNVNKLPKPSPILFGNVEQKTIPVSAIQTNGVPLQKESAKMADPIPFALSAAFHRLAAEENINDAQRQVWYKIPPWLAGKWQVHDKVLVGEVNCVNGKSTEGRSLSFGHCGEQYGLQQNADGTFWQFEKLGNVPTNFHIDKNGLAHFFVLESNKALSNSDTELVLQKRWSTVVMNPVSMETLDVKHLESTLVFKRIDDDTIEIADNTAVFNRLGMPLTRRLVQTTKVKAGSFEPVNERKGENLRALFTAYVRKS